MIRVAINEDLFITGARVIAIRVVAITTNEVVIDAIVMAILYYLMITEFIVIIEEVTVASSFN